MKNSEFITGKVPITKEEIRAIAINKLDLKGKKHFVDVGAGTGTVGIEVALQYEDIKVIAIECKKEAVLLTKENMEKFQVKNMELVEGYAPILLGYEVDGIFIGGTGGHLEEILKWSYESLNEGGRVVANFIIIDTFYEALRIIRALGFREIEVTQLGVATLKTLGSGEYFSPANPIYMIEGTK